MARTNRCSRGLLAGLATITLLIGAPVSASAADSSGLDELAAEMGISERADLAELKQEVKKAARDQGVTQTEIIEAALKESREARAAAMPEAQEGEFTTMSSGCTGARPPSASRKGDVIYSPAGIGPVTYGHSAIYYTLSGYVEAPGPGSNSRYVSIRNTQVCKGSKLQYVKTTTSNRNSAANRAYSVYRHKPYDTSFWNNKSNGAGKLNCSELVWRAYRYSSSGIDLDSNGGGGVYPANIRDSSRTVTYRTV